MRLPGNIVTPIQSKALTPLSLMAPAALLLLPLPALAYLDPVTGSFVIQGLIAGIAAVLASIRSFRQKIADVLFRRRRIDPRAEDRAEAEIKTTNHE